jgi:hypothetical protein
MTKYRKFLSICATLDRWNISFIFTNLFRIFVIRDLTLPQLRNSIQSRSRISRFRGSSIKALAIVIVAFADGVWVFCTLFSTVDGLLGDRGALSRGDGLPGDDGTLSRGDGLPGDDGALSHGGGLPGDDGTLSRGDGLPGYDGTLRTFIQVLMNKKKRILTTTRILR